MRPPGRQLREMPGWEKWVGQVVDVDGIRVRIDPSLSPLMVRKIALKLHTRAERAVALSVLLPDDTVMDLGAGVGMVTIACAQRVGSEQVFGYEANPELERVARANFELNGVAPTLKMAMLGREPGAARFHVSRHFSRSSVFRAADAERTITTPVLSLDGEVRATGANFLVADIEGAEADTLTGADLRPFRAIVFEAHPLMIGAGRTNALRRYLRRSGFRETFFPRADMLLYVRPTTAAGEGHPTVTRNV